MILEATVGKDFSWIAKTRKNLLQSKRNRAGTKARLQLPIQGTRVETLVTITLAREGRNTRLTLVHSGWDAFRRISRVVG